MKKIVTILIVLLFQTSGINATSATEVKRISVGNKNAKITILAYESLTCSHCANFHINVFPNLKKEFIDTGIVKIEFSNFPLDMAALNASKIAHCKNDGKSNILHFLCLTY